MAWEEFNFAKLIIQLVFPENSPGNAQPEFYFTSWVDPKNIFDLAYAFLLTCAEIFLTRRCRVKDSLKSEEGKRMTAAGNFLANAFYRLAG